MAVTQDTGHPPVVSMLEHTCTHKHTHAQAHTPPHTHYVQMLTSKIITITNNSRCTRICVLLTLLSPTYLLDTKVSVGGKEEERREPQAEGKGLINGIF